VTRNPSSSASQALRDLGAEVVQGNLSDLPSLALAFKDAHAIFVNTDFHEVYRGSQALGLAEQDTSKLAFDQEVLHGKYAAIAAASVSSLERFVYSALGPIKKHSKGKYASNHWDSKAGILEFVEERLPNLYKKLSVIYLGGYNTNPFFKPRYDAASGKYQFILPMTKGLKLPTIDATTSTGLFVRALVETEEPGTKLLAYDSYPTVEEMVAMWSKASGREAVLVEVTIEFAHKQFGIPMEMLAGPAFITEFGYMGGVEGFIEPGQLKTKVQTKSYGEWLAGRNWEEILGSA